MFIDILKLYVHIIDSKKCHLTTELTLVHICGILKFVQSDEIDLVMIAPTSRPHGPHMLRTDFTCDHGTSCNHNLHI